MERTIEYAITQQSSVKGFLKGREYSVQNLKELKQDPEGILLNGVPVHLNASLQSGDRLTVQIRETASSENILPIPLPLKIVYEDDDLMVLDKPAGMPIHPSQNNRDNTLANALAYYFQQKGQPFVFRCINRLDRDTSGLTVVAKHFVSAGILGQYVANKEAVGTQEKGLSREYLAIVRGTLRPACSTITAPLGRKPGSIIERCIDLENGESAITHYRVLEEKNGYSLVSLHLGTGRTHQIRIHMKYIGHPLVGDYLYNPRNASCPDIPDVISRQALHSCALAFPHPMSGQSMQFTSPLPEDMQRLLR